MAAALLRSATRRPLLGALALLSALTVIMTWPQALHMSTRIPGHDDPLFSMWRLAWIAHALPHDPRHLFLSLIHISEPTRPY